LVKGKHADLEIVGVIQERLLEIIRPREDAHQEALVLQALVALILIPLGLDQDHPVATENDIGQGDVDDCIG